MTSTTKCPICRNKAEYMSFYEEVGKVEEHINCNRCGYYYEYVYGHYYVCIGNKEFTWSYTTHYNRCAFSKLCKKMERAEFMARRNWKKGIRKYNRGDCSD